MRGRAESSNLVSGTKSVRHSQELYKTRQGREGHLPLNLIYKIIWVWETLVCFDIVAYWMREESLKLHQQNAIVLQKNFEIHKLSNQLSNKNIKAFILFLKIYLHLKCKNKWIGFWFRNCVMVTTIQLLRFISLKTNKCLL